MYFLFRNNIESSFYFTFVSGIRPRKANPSTFISPFCFLHAELRRKNKYKTEKISCNLLKIFNKIIFVFNNHLTFYNKICLRKRQIILKDVCQRNIFHFPFDI